MAVVNGAHPISTACDPRVSVEKHILPDGRSARLEFSSAKTRDATEPKLAGSTPVAPGSEGLAKMGVSVRLGHDLRDDVELLPCRRHRLIGTTKLEYAPRVRSDQNSVRLDEQGCRLQWCGAS